MPSGTAPAAAGPRAPRRAFCAGARRPVESAAWLGAGAVLPRRSAVADWDRFVALVPLSRSAAELLTAVLHRPVRAEPIGNRVVETPGRYAVRVLQHRLVDSRAPERALALCATALDGARLPRCIQPAARRGSEPLSELLDRAGAFWTAETLDVEQLPGTAGWSGGAPVLRVTRRLFLLGNPVADVVEDIPFVRGPPELPAVLAPEPPPAAGTG